MIKPFQGIHPRIAETAFIAETAVVIGDVTIGEQSSLWYNVVARGDVNSIRIGARSNIQDLTMLHVGQCGQGGELPPGPGDHLCPGPESGQVCHGPNRQDLPLLGRILPDP